MDDPVELSELSEDIEVVGPGQMLAEARQNVGMSIEDVAQRLNFTQSLVKNIEADDFNPTLPATFIRGYLKNYAKLVGISEKDILASYDLLGIAQLQCAEMQSFSRITKKQAANSRLMWFSYLIVIVLVGLTILWWLQDVKPEIAAPLTHKTELKAVKQQASTESPNAASSQPPTTNAATPEPLTGSSDQLKTIASDTASQLPITNKAVNSVTHELANHNQEAQSVNTQPASPISNVVFTFTGDCWVNIYDHTGARIAWGIKKAGYVMTIKGEAPFSITLGKPELVSIMFDQQAVDMSKFNAGNIAKFTLPLKP